MKKLWIICLLLVAHAAGATTYELSNSLDKAALSTSATLRVVDAAVVEEIQSPSLYAATRSNRVGLVYSRDGLSDITHGSDWKLEVNYRIYETSNPGSFETGTLELTAQHGADIWEDWNTHNLGVADATVELTNITAWSFDGSSWVVFSGSVNTWAGVPEDLRLDLVTTTERYTYLSTSNVPTIQVDPNNTSADFDDEIHWSYVPGAEAYDVEWVFIDDEETTDFSSFTEADYFDFKEPVRVRTKEHAMRLNRAYPKGSIRFRVRAVGRYIHQVGTDYSHLKLGQWGYYQDAGGAQAAVLTLTTGFQPDRNWQMTETFAEDGRHKAVVAYYDGLLRERQTLTHLSSEEVTVAAESALDDEGRPVVQFLPVPLSGIDLNFQENLYQNSAGNAYGPDDIFGAGNQPAAPVNPASTGGAYYSPNNTFLSDATFQHSHPYMTSVPDAGGFPLTQTEYMRDGTGRPMRSGGPGATHQIGVQDMRYFYGTPTSTELRRLFGGQVGTASHYRKNMVLDQNGSVSVTYLDQENRTIATAKAGPAPSSLDQLISYAPYTQVEDLVANNTFNEAEQEYKSTSGILNILPSLTYSFSYDLTGVIAALSVNQPEVANILTDGLFFNITNSDFCLSCDYELTISIYDPDGLPVTISGDLNGTTPISVTITGNDACVTPSTFEIDAYDFTATFDKVGSYTVVKTLKLLNNNTELIAAIDNITGNEGLLQTLIQSYQNQIDLSGCDFTCADVCSTQVLMDDPTLTGQDLIDAVEACVEANCDPALTSMFNHPDFNDCAGYLELMKADVSPFGGAGNGGWLYVDDVFMNAHVSEINSTFQNAPYNPADYPGIPFADADQLRQNWNDDFAEILVTHHREYCFYTECTNYQATRIFNLEMNRTFTWSDAIANGYANPLQMVNDREYPIGAINNTNIQYSFTPTPSVSDPILAINPTVADALRARLANWDGNDNSLWYWSSQTNQGPTYTAAMQADPNLTVDEIHWMIFRGLYMGAKTQLIRDAQVATCGPFTDDEHTIFQDPVLPNNLNDLSAFIDDNLDFWTEDCVTICENNVAIWLNTYVAKCDLDPLSSDYTQLKTALETYCASADGCSSGNPFGWISQDEVNLVLANDPDASVPLSDLINSINSLGLGCGIEEIWTENTGTEQCETLPAYTTYQLDGCFDSWVNFLNANLFDPSISVSYANYGGVSNFHFDFIDCNNFSCYGGPGSPTETGVIVHGPYLLLDPNLGLPALGVPPTPDATNSYLFYLPNGSVINATDIDEIIGYSIVPIPGGGLTGTLTSGGISRQYKMLELNVQVGGNFETVYLYGPAGCSLVKQINVAAQTICFTIPPTNPVQIDWEQLQTECVNEMMAIAEEQALEEYNRQRGFFFGNVVNEYRSQCENINESFKVTYQSTEHHYTLFYYDQAGNLVQTVPPEGVNPLDATHFNADGVWDGTPTDHSMRTRYVYNSLDELVRQETPDGGTTEFYYDLKGRIVASQDAGQATEGGSNYRAYNYTNYDAQGRPVEAGEVRVSPSSALSGLIEAEQDLVLNDGNFPATVGTLWNSLSRREVTQTHYDDALALGHVTQEMGNGAQQYLRNRVSHITNEQYYDGDPLTYDHATHYNYDPHGNVDILLQEQTRLSSMGHALKRVEYDYDLLTGNVNELAYQDGKDDQYYHQYEYDADNRITIAYSGTHREHLEQEAKYFYHLHGPLARTEIGHDKVQAIDQAYTIHGWLKGSNAESLNYLRDIGRDGDQTNSDNRNQLVGQDAFGYSLRYYGNDYTSIGFTNFLAAEPTAPTWAEWDLFNGNIKAMTTALSNYNEAPMQVLRNHYRYDELHRLKEMRAHIAHTDLRDLNTWDNTTASNEYHVTVSYDANGNINNLSRNGNQTDGLPMDRLRYHYIDGTNQLEYVDDNHPVAPATASVYTRDLEDQSIGNYAYDATGQLIQDNQEEIESIEWTASGKVRAVNRTASSTKPNLYFEYDALDNRILKLVKPRDGGVLSNEGDWVYTHYVRDGEGNLLATYEQTAPQVGSGTPATTEVKLPSGNLTNQFVLLRVGTTDLMDMAVTWQGSFAATLQAVVDEVNNGAASVAGWSAIVFANKIKLFAPTDNPTQYNNLQIFNNYSGSGTAMNLGLVPQLSGGTAGDPIYHKQLSHEEHHIYGTARHGIHKSKKPMYSSHQVIADLAIDGSFAPGSAQVLYTTDVSEAPKRKRILGRKVYELANHLGNVLVTVSDKKLPYEETDNVNGGIQPVFDPMKIQYDPQANTYTKISTTPGWNAGGHSTQTSQGACWAEFTIAAPASVNNGLAVGLSFDPHSGEHYNTIDYSITVYMAGGQLRALPYHFGQSLGSPVNVAPGDVLRISRVGTSIRFFKNGSSPYQWQQQNNISATDPMLIDFSIRDENTSITGLTIAGFSQDVMGYTADVISHSDYYPFGMTMSARTAYDTEYRYGFNGMERDDEINGGSSYTSHWRGYDPRLGRWLSTDPMEAKYPSMSPYSSNFNNPIVFIDPDGDDPFLGVIDAITAFIVESGTNFLSNWLISGMTPSQAFDNIQWSSAAWEAGKAYAFSWFTPTGTAAARMIYKVGKTRIGRLTITIVDEFVTEALKKYSLGDYNDEDGDFDYEKILNTNELTKLFIHSTLGALINSGSIEQARRFKEQMIKLNKDHAPIFDKFMRQLQGEKGSLKHTHSKLDNIVQKQKNLTTNRVIDKAKGGAKSTAVQDISNKAAEKLFPSNGSESKPVRASSSSGNETKPARASSTQGTSTNRKVPAKAGSGREIRIIKNKNRGAIF